MLEFGDQYMRIKYRGAYVTEAAEPILDITQANPAVLQIVGHGYSVNDWIYIQSAIGMTEFNSLTWIVNGVLDADHVTLTDLFGNVVDSTNFPMYTTGGTASRIYTVVAPYAAVDLPYLKFTQSADTMTLTCVNTDTETEYPSYELTRFADTNWTFTADTFTAGISAPTGLTASAQSSTVLSTWYSYVVTAVSGTTGEESVASAAVNVQNNNISINAGSNTISWAPVAGATSYNVYKATPSYSIGVPVSSLYGFMGTSLGTSLTDTNISPDFTVVPPVHNNPFGRGVIQQINPTGAGVNYSQGTIGYSITTSTGSGFIGEPVVVGGSLSGFIVQNGGTGYVASDTISFTDTGGGVAVGGFTVTANAADGDSIGINGVGLKFRRSSTAPGFNEFTLGNTIALTIQSLSNYLNASTDISLICATYTYDATHLYITYKTPGAAGNAFTLGAAPTGWTKSGTNLTGGGAAGTGASATLTVGPETGTYPGTVAYFQQRRVYAATLNNPDTYYMSQPGAYLNMDSSIPVTDADAIVGTPWAQQVNGIQFMVPMPGGLVVLTGKGAWQVTGGSQTAAITPANQNAIPQAYNGCNNIVVPLTINDDILYVQSKGSIARDLGYNFFSNIYTGSDLTVLSNQLFNDRTILQWCYAEEPYKLVWAVRDDGIMLCLTYLKDQEVYAWSRHDTNGYFVSVCSVTEPPVDAVYVIVKRLVQGGYQYYSERMDNRNWDTVEDCVCSDSALTYPLTSPNTILQPNGATGTQNISSVSVIFGGSGYTAPTITAIDPDNIGSGAAFSAIVVGGVITAVTVLTQGSLYTQGNVDLQITDSTGANAVLQAIVTNIVQFNAGSGVFSPSNVGDVIRADGGKAVVTSYLGPAAVLANIIEPLTQTVPNDPAEFPLEVQPGNWTIGTPTQIVSKLNHLEGLTVTALADGSVVPNQVVTNGAITLPVAASAITVGLPYTCQLQTTWLDVPSQSGTSQNKRKNISSVGLRVEGSRGLQVGCNQSDASFEPSGAVIPWTNATGMKEIKDRSALIDAGTATPLFTGDYFKNISGNWAVEGQVAVQQVYPLPANILAAIFYLTVGDDA